MRVNAVARPSIWVTWAREKRAWVPKTLPVRRWQSRQWQIEIRTGSPSQARRSWPQLQCASRVTMARLSRDQRILKLLGAVGRASAGMAGAMGRPTNWEVMPVIQRWARSVSWNLASMARPRVTKMPRSAPS